MSTHQAVVTASIRGPLEVIQVPTIAPVEREVRVRVEWTASTPLDLHQNDGGLLVKHPQVLGGGIAGTVVELGPSVRNLQVGDKVFGFGWREQKEKAYQQYSVLPEFLLGVLPKGFTLEQAVTLPNNFVTVFHSVTADLRLPLPWPKPADYRPPHADNPILIWGGSSSVGQYALQILSFYSYRNLFATASKAHHQLLQSFGASYVFDYRDPDIAAHIIERGKSLGRQEPAIPFVLDCIGSKSGSLAPIAKLAQKGARIAVLLPVIVKDAGEDVAPEYSMDTQASADWAEGVAVNGVRTHFYLERHKNEFFRDNLQSSIMPTMLGLGIVKPNKHRIVEGNSLLDRAQNAMDSLRRKEVSGERLVWRISENED